MKYLVIPLLLISTTLFSQQNIDYYVNNEKPYTAHPETGQLPTGTTETEAFNSIYQLQHAIESLSLSLTYNITIYIKANPQKNYLNENPTIGEAFLSFYKEDIKINTLIIRNYLTDNANPVLDASNNSFGVEITLHNRAMINNVYVHNLTIKNSSDDALKIRGQVGRLISNATVENCSLLQSRKRGINANNIQTLIVKNNQIKSEGTSLENDGMYLENCITSTISNNYIETYNSFSTESGSPHVDCIQTVGCKDVSIFNNKLISNSNLSYYAHRSGIIMSGNTGNVNIYNNIIKSFSNNLINADLLQSSSYLKIFNNTLIGIKQNHLLNLKSNNQLYNNIEVKNNILQKENDAPILIKFIGVNKDVNFLNINNNYYYTEDVLPKMGFDEDDNDLTPMDIRILNETINSNPLFDTTTLKISRYSPAKNQGAYLSSITNDINNNKRPHWQKESFDIGAEEIPDAQIKIGITGMTISDNPELNKINHTITAFGATWSSNQLNIDNSAILKSTTYQTIGNTDPSLDMKYWDGFTYNWLKQGTSDPNSPCGIGIYKISNSHDPSKYFYLDMRHCRNDVDFNPNINIRYFIDEETEIFRYEYYKNNVWQPINYNGELIQIWNILDEQPNTAPLSNFWPNSLVLINEINNPLLIWGKYPAELISNNYGIYVKYGSLAWARRFSLTNEFHKLDLDIFISNQNTVTPYQYKIGVEPSDFVVYTNTEQVLVGGADPAKLATSKVMSFDYSLSQNYPNPFNPNTVITFTIRNQEYVEMRVYDVLGREIRTLLNQEIEPGEHNVTFDAGNLPSGIYFYNIKAGDFIQSHKMILMK